MRRDTDKYEYKVLDQEMADFITAMSQLSVSVGALICEKSQLKYHKYKREQARATGQPTEPQSQSLPTRDGHYPRFDYSSTLLKY